MQNDFLYRLKGHGKTILNHKKQVLKNCIRAGIIKRGILHDLSKFSPEEFLNGVKYYAGDHSPNENERYDKGYSNAWMHHKGRNKHHFEYWMDYNPYTKNNEPIKMPLIYVIEMFCDRVAASKVYMKENYTDAAPLEYFLKAKHRRIIHKETSKLLESLLVMLKENGEEKTFDFIKNNLLKHKDY